MPFANHDHLGAPPGNTIIWRYMGLDKFLDLITHSHLFFTNVHNLTDQYEASLPADLARKHRDLTAKQQTGELNPGEQELLNKLNHAIRAAPLVNCWSLGRTESYALWKVYLSGSEAGVAIRTSISNLRRAIELGDDLDKLDIYTGRVQYTDRLDASFISEFSLVTMKREFYEYEQELRFITFAPQAPAVEPLPTNNLILPPAMNSKLGRYVQVDVSTLIGRLYLSPFMGSWFMEAVVDFLRKLQPALLEPNPEERVMMSSILDS